MGANAAKDEAKTVAFKLYSDYKMRGQNRSDSHLSQSILAKYAAKCDEYKDEGYKKIDETHFIMLTKNPQFHNQMNIT